MGDAVLAKVSKKLQNPKNKTAVQAVIALQIPFYESLFKLRQRNFS